MFKRFLAGLLTAVMLVTGSGFTGIVQAAEPKDVVITEKADSVVGIEQIVLSDSMSAAITEYGSLYVWGANGGFKGEDGNLGTADSSTPVKILENVKEISLGHGHSAAVTEDGDLYTWGLDRDGGNRNIFGFRMEPEKVMENVISVKSNSGSSLGDAVITEDGSLYTWDYDESGFTLKKVMEKVVWASVDGYSEGVAITEDGSLYAWGYESSTPVKIMGNVMSASFDGSRGVAITEDGSLYTLKNVFATDFTPVKIMENVVSVSLGGSHSAAITEDGSLYTWGNNYYGQLGNGTTTDSSTPVKIMENVVSVSLGGSHSAAITEDGSLYIWGDNYYGQLGNGTTTDSSTPVKVTFPAPTAEELVNKQKKQVEAFVTRMYTVVLDREPDKTGIADWTNWLLTHEVDGAGIAHGFIMSEEFLNKGLSDEAYVDVLYRTFFDREADAGGKETWMNLLAQGSSRGYVLSGFVNSKEFESLCESYGILRGTMSEDGTPGNDASEGSGIRQFVERCYSTVLGRAGDEAGLDTWENLITTGQMTAEDVAKTFFDSEEFLNKNTTDAEYINILYATFLDRAADDAGRQTWTDGLADGMTRTEVLQGFSQSEEFKAILASYGL